MYKRKKTYELRHNQISHGRPWSEPEKNIVRKLAGTINTKLLARQINRSYESLRQMAKREGIRLRRV